MEMMLPEAVFKPDLAMFAGFTNEGTTQSH